MLRWQHRKEQLEAFIGTCQPITNSKVLNGLFKQQTRLSMKRATSILDPEIFDFY